MRQGTGMYSPPHRTTYTRCSELLLCRPRCPQVDVDVKHLLRIPEDFAIASEPEDEFECLNLEITCPPVSSGSDPLPVLVWIHGLVDSNLVEIFT